MRLLKIGYIFIYILFTQVYTSVHLHAYEHQDKIEIELSVHPPEFSKNHHGHDEHHDHATEHEHEDLHFVGDWEYNFQSRTFSPVLIVNSIIFHEIIDDEPPVLTRMPRDFPLKLPESFLPSILPERAPPQPC